MVSSERIAEFIREGFKEFGLSFEEFFSDYDEDTNEVVDYNLIQENGSIDPAAVAVASEALGFREKDVYAAREKAIDRWFKKFPSSVIWGITDTHRTQEAYSPVFIEVFPGYDYRVRLIFQRTHRTQINWFLDSLVITSCFFLRRAYSVVFCSPFI